MAATDFLISPDSEDLDDWFPRSKTMTAPVKEDKRDWKRFWTLAENVVEPFGITRADKDKFVHDFFGAASMKDRPEKCSELLDMLEDGGAEFAKAWLSEQRHKDTPEIDYIAPPLDESATLPVVTPENDKSPETAKTEPSANDRNKFQPSPLLTNITTLTGIPVGRIHEFMRRPHEDRFYGKTKDFGTQLTTLKSTAVRQRFEKIFGPHGFGWRIVPAKGVGHMEVIPVDKGEKVQYTPVALAFVLEYALVINGKIEYMQTSAFSDSHADNNGNMGYSLRGTYTSLLKQALKEFGGYEHFIDED